MIDASNTTLRASHREEVLTVEEAAGELRVSPGVIYAGIRKKLIPTVPMPGRIIRIPRGGWERYKRGELDEKGEVRAPTQHQSDLLKGVKSIIRR